MIKKAQRPNRPSVQFYGNELSQDHSPSLEALRKDARAVKDVFDQYSKVWLKAEIGWSDAEHAARDAFEKLSLKGIQAAGEEAATFLQSEADAFTKTFERLKDLSADEQKLFSQAIKDGLGPDDLAEAQKLANTGVQSQVDLLQTHAVVVADGSGIADDIKTIIQVVEKVLNPIPK